MPISVSQVVAMKASLTYQTLWQSVVSSIDV